MKLVDVAIHKYKSFADTQSFELQDGITILVGMNESGKTSALEAIAKTNYFQDDDSFTFNASHDYPRAEKKRMDKSGIVPKAISCTYEIDDKLLQSIEKELGEGVVQSNTFSVTTGYDGGGNWGKIRLDTEKCIANLTSNLGISGSHWTHRRHFYLSHAASLDSGLW